MRVTIIIVTALGITVAAAGFRGIQANSAKPSGSQDTKLDVVTKRPMPEYMKARSRPYYEAVDIAQRLYQAGDLAGAEAQCTNAQALLPKKSGLPVNPAVAGIMGDIRLRQGKNHEALDWFLGSARHAAGGTANLNVTIAYCRLGDRQNAKRFFSDGPIQHGWKDYGGMRQHDYPGTSTLVNLEASALLGKGIDAFAEDRTADALQHLLAAERLAPKSPLVAYCLSDIYLRPPGDAQSALPRLRIAATATTPRLHDMAKEKLGAVEYWLKLHPPQTGNAGQ